MIFVSENFWYDCIDNHENRNMPKNQAIALHLRKILKTEVTCEYKGCLRSPIEPIWAIHLTTNHEILFRIKYSEYILHD